jgi:hypothetical protein
MFHRLTVPTYFGGLPVGADYLNTPSDPSVGGSGVPATADGKKSGGPNDGTYFYAFGEDATSYFLNRGVKAVGENTDTLDDYLHRDVAVPVRTLSSTAGTPVSAIAITGQIFIGALGTVNNQENRDSLFSVLDSSGNEILAATGSGVVQVGLVHDGSGNNVVGTLASGFRNGVSLTLTNAIPVGTTYYVVYGERGNLAALPVDAFTSIKVRASQEVSAEVERLLRDLHGTEAYQFAWNDPWPVSINGLLRGGLDARYRNSSADAGTTGHIDTAGAGSRIYRDGPAVTFACPNFGWDTIGYAENSTPDPTLACLRITRSSTANTMPSQNLGGDIGLMQESPYAHTYDYTSERPWGNHLTGPLLLDVAYYNFGASTIMGNTLLTRIGTENVALLNPDATGEGLTPGCLRTLQVASPDYLRLGGATALRTTDLIEVINHSTGAVIGTFRVDDILSDTRFRLRALSGDNGITPGVAMQATQVRLRWLQPTLSAGGRFREYATNPDYNTPHFMVAQPGQVTSDVNEAVWATHNAIFLSALNSRKWNGTQVTNDMLLSSMAWGGFDIYGRPAVKGVLRGDGGIDCIGGRQRMNLLNRAEYISSYSGAGSVTCVSPYGAASHIEYYVNPTATTHLTFQFLMSSWGYAYEVGDEFDFALHIAAGAVGPLDMIWPADFHFSGNDATVPGANATANTYTLLYRFKYINRNGTPGWYATRTDYDS